MAVSRLQNLAGDLTPIADHYNRTIACTQAYYVQHYQDPKETSPFPDGCFIVVKDDTQSVMNGFVDQMFPIGSVYMNALVQTDPHVLFNFGTWARITGKFLYAADTSDTLLDTGGASTVTLTQENLPATATFTIPALDLNIDSTSTAHTHTFTTDATTNNSCSFSFGSGRSAHWKAYPLEGCTSYKAGSSGSYDPTEGISPIGNNDAISIDFNHSHGGTTNGMSANETHTHTGSTTVASKTISDFGSGTAFDIIPPYVKLAIWYRAS